MKNLLIAAIISIYFFHLAPLNATPQRRKEQLVAYANSSDQILMASDDKEKVKDLLEKAK